MKSTYVTFSVILNVLFIILCVGYLVLMGSVDAYQAKAILEATETEGMWQCTVTIWETARYFGFFREEHVLANMTFPCRRGEYTEEYWGRYDAGSGMLFKVFIPPQDIQGNATCLLHIIMDHKTTFQAEFEVAMFDS